MVILENKQLRAVINPHGAELASLQKQKGGMEFIWQADPFYWPRHAPVLFPIVGRLKDDEYILDGQTYSLSQHGFARGMDFEIVQEKNLSMMLRLTETEKSLTKFPYRFALEISYELEKNTLITTYRVVNMDDKTMYFSLGGHPGFRCPLKDKEQRSDYSLVFEKEETEKAQRIEGGYRTGEVEDVFENGNVIPITDHLFDKDALIFTNLNSKSVTLQRDKKKILTFGFKGFPYLGIWSKNDMSEFVCIEPWLGLCDRTDHDKDFTKKEGIQKLAPGKSLKVSYKIKVH